ncbi:MAG: response regulator transcription factor [Chloroflexi bacterium]|jgi:DNA-binding response OmpR family regulator|nr:response regulator transcription factor [Chloroflexota bacterium]
MNQPTILVVDDDPIVLKFVSANLRARDFQVITAEDGEAALKIIEQKLPDLIIVDTVMPRMDGIEMCQRVREWSQVPIVMLSAKGELQDTVNALNLGVDDYVTKPFSVDELMARVQAVLRRKSGISTSDTSILVNDDLTVNFAERRVTVKDKEINLTPTEYHLLRELGQNAGQVLTHPTLLSRIWGAEYGNEREYLRVYIGRLRNKIETDPQNPKHIHTRAGVGYCLQKLGPKKV